MIVALSVILRYKDRVCLYLKKYRNIIFLEIGWHHEAFVPLDDRLIFLYIYGPNKMFIPSSQVVFVNN